MRYPEHSAGSSGCTPPPGEECSQLLEAWYFPALMRETSTHSTTKQERRYGISRRGARSRQTRSPSAWTDTSGLPSAPIACCMFSDSEQSNERASLPLGSRTAANEVIRDDVLSTTRARSPLVGSFTRSVPGNALVSTNGVVP